MKSLILKHAVAVAGRKTSVCLEDAFWNSLKEIGVRRHMTLSALVTAIDAKRCHDNLSSAIRLFILDFYLEQLAKTPTRVAPLGRLEIAGPCTATVQIDQQQAL